MTLAQLENAVIGTLSTSHAVTTLDMPFVNDLPTLADMDVVRATYCTLVLALRH